MCGAIMTDGFTGLCIEGPLAGKWVTHSAPWYKTVERRPASIYQLEPNYPTVDMSTKVHEYKHIVGFRYRKEGRWNEDVLNFWIPRDKDWTPLDCVRRMAEDYAKYHDLRNS